MKQKSVAFIFIFLMTLSKCINDLCVMPEIVLLPSSVNAYQGKNIPNYIFTYLKSEFALVTKEGKLQEISIDFRNGIYLSQLIKWTEGYN